MQVKMQQLEPSKEHLADSILGKEYNLRYADDTTLMAESVEEF